MITRQEIDNLSREEKWRTMEMLQESLEGDEPRWIGPLLAHRKAELDEGTVQTWSLEEIEDRFRARRA